VECSWCHRSIINNNGPDPDICEIQFDYGPGDKVHKFHIGPHRIGHVVTKGKTLEEAKAVLDRAMAGITIEVE
jgi:hypothetical protein